MVSVVRAPKVASPNQETSIQFRWGLPWIGSGRSAQPSRRVSETLTPPDSNCPTAEPIRCDRVISMRMHVAEITTSVVGPRDGLNVIDDGAQRVRERLASCWR